MTCYNYSLTQCIPISGEDRALIERLIPMDLWLYNYGLSLFEARWKYFTTGGEFVKPELPPFPKIECESTRYAMKCTSEPKIYGALKQLIRISEN